MVTIFRFLLQIPILFYPTIRRISVPNPPDYADRATLVPTTTTAEIEGETPESSNTGRTRLPNQLPFIYLCHCNETVAVAAGRHPVPA